MDRITASMLESFKNKFELNIPDVSLAFEYFANYCVVNHEYGGPTFDLEEITTGISTQGIDGIAIIANQKLIESTEDIDQLIAINQCLNVKFVMIQTKTSDSFSNTELSNFTTYSSVFFGNNNEIFSTPQMKKFIELKDYIFSKGDKLRKNPELLLYYVTLGTWSNDENILYAANVGKETLRRTNLFSNIEFKPVGSAEIQNLFRRTNSKLTATFRFEKRVTMYSENAEELGYCGVIPFKEFRKIIMEENGTIKPVFEDNIRDFLGLNLDVNKSIQKTVEENNVNAFCMLNNGITIVTNSILLPGDNASIEDYQIVNGCQTSHILIESVQSGKNIDDLLIPIRIIATKNENLKNQITKATNDQTAIKKEQLEALSTFQKKLEEYYATYTDVDSLVYERRTGQYRNSTIPKTHIISIPYQIKAVSAMFLNEPSAVSGQYGTVAKRVGNQIFKPADKPIMYYVSSMALYKTEFLIRTGKIDKELRRARYHAIMLFRIALSSEEMPRQFNSRKMEGYCQKLLNVLMNSDLCESVFKKIFDFISLYRDDIDFDNRKCFERKETTEFFLNHISELKNYIDADSANEGV